MNRLLYIMAVLVLGFSWYLKWCGERYYSMGTFVMAVFMWMALLGNELKNNDKNQDYGNN